MADLVTRFYAESTIEGSKRTLEWTSTLSSQVSCYDQLLPLTTTKAEVLTIATDEAGRTLEDITCLVLENRSSTIDIYAALSQSAKGVWHLIPAGKFMVFWSKSIDCDDDAAAGASPSFAPIAKVEAKAASGNPVLRVLAFDDTAVGS